MQPALARADEGHVADTDAVWHIDLELPLHKIGRAPRSGYKRLTGEIYTELNVVCNTSTSPRWLAFALPTQFVS